MFLSFVNLKTFSANAIVATYPSAGGRRGAHGRVFQERNTRGVATNVYLRKNNGKTGKDVVYEF